MRQYLKVGQRGINYIYEDAILNDNVNPIFFMAKVIHDLAFLKKKGSKCFEEQQI